MALLQPSLDAVEVGSVEVIFVVSLDNILGVALLEIRLFFEDDAVWLL
jgi:hypothetical protein